MSVFSFTKRADYALSMLSVLAKRGRGARVSLAELAELGMPRAFMGQIASDLVEAGILSSKEGRGGGNVLREEPEEVSLGDVLEAVEGPVEVVECVGEGGNCVMEGNCSQKGFMASFKKKVEKMLFDHTLIDLIGE